MGRHSAPDDDERDLGIVVPAVHARPRPGRHARADDEHDTEPIAAEQHAPTEILPVAEQPTELVPVEHEPAELVPVEEQPTELVPRAAPGRVARGNQSTAADLELLRKHPDLRARVIAALIVPFVLYVAVMVFIGARTVQYFVFIWIPMVSAGLLAGLLLDAAHRRYGTRKPAG